MYRPLKFANDRHLEIINDNSSDFGKKSNKLNNAIKIALSTSKISRYFYKAKSLFQENFTYTYFNQFLSNYQKNVM